MYLSFHAAAIGIGIIIALFIAAYVWIKIRRYSPARHELLKAAEELQVSNIETSLGQMSYRDKDGRYPVMVMHGPGEGSISAVLRAEKHLESECRIIVPSRFGYDGTPLHADSRSPEAQADCYAAFLDALHIERTAVLAYSSAYPAALSYVSKYADSVSSLILVSPTLKLRSSQILKLGLRIRLSWFLLPLRSIERLVSMKNRTVSPQLRRELDTYLMSCAINSKGLHNDLRMTNFHDKSASESLSRIGVPVLIIYCPEDTLVDISSIKQASENNQSLKIVPVMQGGHLLLGGRELIRTETDLFLHLQGGMASLGMDEPVKRRKGIRTKQMLFHEALNLFADMGFSGSSLRELSSRVGIKESSIYNHYSSKEEILEDVFIFYGSRMKEMRPALKDIHEAAMYLSAEELLTHILLTEINRFDADFEKASRIVLNERYIHPRARALYLEAAVDETVEYYTHVFKHLQDLGKIASGDPSRYARQYRAVLADLQEEHALKSGGSEPGVSFKKHIIEHARIFAGLIENVHPRSG